jgi:cell division septum initiation protein DivIVA
MAQSFQDYITKERERLSQEANALRAQQKELEEKLAANRRELRAVEAYEAAKSGKAAPTRSTRRASQARSGSKRDGILKVIKENPTGLTRGQLLEKMGLKGNKSGEMSVSNALTALTKGNQVARKDGKYIGV